MNSYLGKVLEETRAKNQCEPEFIQAVEEVLETLSPVVDAHPEYQKIALLERLVEPERIISFSLRISK